MNTKLCLLSALLWLPTLPAFGQTKLSVSATVVPTISRTVYSYRYFYPESDGQVVEPVYLSGRKWASGYSAGLSLVCTYAPGWSVSSGLWYQQLSTQQARQPTAGEGTVTLRRRAVRVPILLNYCPSAKRLSPCFSLGVLTDIPMSSRVVVDRTGQSTQYLRLKTTQRPIFHLLLGAGAQYRLDSHYSLLAQPVLVYKLGQLGGASTSDPSVEFNLLMQVAYAF